MTTDEARPPDGRVRIAISWLVLALAVGYSAFNFAFMLNTRGEYARFFAAACPALKTTLPVLTAVVLHPVYPLLLAALGIAGIAKELLVQNKTVAVLLNGLHVLLASALVWMYDTAVSVPLNQIQALLQR